MHCDIFHFSKTLKVKGSALPTHFIHISFGVLSLPVLELFLITCLYHLFHLFIYFFHHLRSVSPTGTLLYILKQSLLFFTERQVNIRSLWRFGRSPYFRTLHIQLDSCSLDHIYHKIVHHILHLIFFICGISHENDKTLSSLNNKNG